MVGRVAADQSTKWFELMVDQRTESHCKAASYIHVHTEVSLLRDLSGTQNEEAAYVRVVSI